MTKRDTPSLLRDLRKRVGYSRDKLAAELGFSHGSALREHRRELNRLRSQVALAIAFGAGALVVIALRLWT